MCSRLGNRLPVFRLGAPDTVQRTTVRPLATVAQPGGRGRAKRLGSYLTKVIILEWTTTLFNCISLHQLPDCSGAPTLRFGVEYECYRSQTGKVERISDGHKVYVGPVTYNSGQPNITAHDWTLLHSGMNWAIEPNTVQQALGPHYSRTDTGRPPGHTRQGTSLLRPEPTPAAPAISGSSYQHHDPEWQPHGVQPTGLGTG